MLERFFKYIEKYNLIPNNEPVLLAISGGIDSMCMLHLFLKAEIKVGIAHCNFGLRSTESDMDEQFVKKIADQYQLKFYSKKFNTIEFAKLKKVSIQVAARELRYSWFENLRRIHKYGSIAIAHNADDSIETFFINLIRGTGINGISGIKNNSKNIIRPLLFAYRSEIETYCSFEKVEYRTDSSNLSDKYLRNKLRNNLIPMLSEIKTDFRETMTANIERFAETSIIYNSYVNDLISRLLIADEQGIFHISINELNSTPSAETILYEILKQFNVNSSLSAEVYAALNSESGKIFFSDTHRIIKDRNSLLINTLKEKEDIKTYIDGDCGMIDIPINLSFNNKKNENFEILKDKNIAALDYDKLCFPLLLRKWQIGDYFKPLGMNGFKKVSDYFIDQKLSLIDKENVWILASADDIVWIVGMRVDERYKITKETKNILVITKT